MIGKQSILIILLTLLGLTAFLNFYPQPSTEPVVNDIDMNCGFTSDFANFLAKS